METLAGGQGKPGLDTRQSGTRWDQGHHERWTLQAETQVLSV